MGDGGVIEWPSSYSDELDRGIYVRMGCVIYPVEVYMIREWVSNNRDVVEKIIQNAKSLRFDLHNFNSFIDTCNSILTVFEIDMGEVEILPSREGLQYGPNDPTCMTIVKKLIEYYETLIPAINQTLAKCPSPFRAIILFRCFSINSVIESYNKIFNCGFTENDERFISTWRGFVNSIDELEWCGDKKAIKDANDLVNLDYSKKDGIKTFGYYHNSTKISFSDSRAENGVQIGVIDSEGKKLPSLDLSRYISIAPYGKTVYLISDFDQKNTYWNNNYSRSANKRDKYRKEIIKKINNFKSKGDYIFTNSNYRYSARCDVVNYVQFDNTNSPSEKVKFFDAFDECNTLIEGIDYDIVFLDEYELPVEEPTVTVRNKRSIAERLETSTYHLCLMLNVVRLIIVGMVIKLEFTDIVTVIITVC
jgi:hypothetical protein